MLKGTDISLVHVGGGTNQGKNEIDQHAKNKSVDLWIAPRLSSEDSALAKFSSSGKYGSQGTIWSDAN